MDFEKIIFKDKTFSSLLEDIYKNAKSKDKQLKVLITQCQDMITSPGEAAMMIPLLKEYLDISVKNDDSLIKMAGIVQKAMNNNSTAENDYGLSEEDKKDLFNEIRKIENK